MVRFRTARWRVDFSGQTRTVRLGPLPTGCPFLAGARQSGEEAMPVFDPCIEVRESRESYLFVADLPGIAMRDVEVLLADDLLIINGEREKEPLGDCDQVFLKARTFGTFSCAFPLPWGLDAASAEATLQDGVLRVRLPKTQRDPLRRLDIMPCALDGAPRSSPPLHPGSSPLNPVPPRPRPS